MPKCTCRPDYETANLNPPRSLDDLITDWSTQLYWWATNDDAYYNSCWLSDLLRSLHHQIKSRQRLLDLEIAPFACDNQSVIGLAAQFIRDINPSATQEEWLQQLIACRFADAVARLQMETDYGISTDDGNTPNLVTNFHPQLPHLLASYTS